MSWFDHLFGEDNQKHQPKRTSERHNTLSNKNENDLLPQSNEIYNRPRGKFRFPIDMHDTEPTSNDFQHSHASEEKEPEHKEHSTQHAKPSFTFNRNERRHRGDRLTDRTSNKTTNAQPSQRSSNETHYHHQPKERNESRSTTYRNHEPIKPTYHQRDFKASQVPSAIFGTKEPKAFENSGLNPISHSTTEERDTQQEVEKERHTNTSQHHVKPQTPNYSKKDNTINIENIYASQIVEEIRREREKKVLQRKRFKEVLEQKKSRNYNSDNADMEKAIDEMYASQARQLLGKDEVDNEFASQDNTAQIDHQENEEPQAQAKEQPSTEDTNEFQYEEVDLTQFDQDDAYSQVENNHQDMTDSTQAIEDTEAVNPSNQVTEQIEEEMNQSDDSEKPNDVVSDESEEETHPHNEVEVIETPDHYDTLEATVDPEEETSSASLEEAIDEQEATRNTVDLDNNRVEEQEAQAPVSSQHETIQSTEDVSVDNTETEHGNDHLPSQSTVNVPELEPEMGQSTPVEISAQKDEEDEERRDVSEQQSTSSSADVKEKPKTPIRKGSKPFNVLMTPSDKKRWQQSQTTASKQNMKSNTAKQKDLVEQTDKNKETNHDDASQEVQTSNTSSENVTESKTVSDTNTNQTTTQPALRRGPNIKLPSIDLLDEPETQERDEEWIQSKKDELNESFYYFNVPAEVVNVVEGPSVTRFELSVEKGVKVSRITALQDDIKMALAAKDIRIEAPIPGTSLVGIEVPNQKPTKVNLRSLIETDTFKQSESKLTVAMGSRINNEPLMMDIAKTPHALIAGATGSGKSVSINSILISLLYRNHPEELKLLLIDPKMVELAPYNELPHLVAPVITDVKAATQSLKWAVEEMEKRYKLFAQKHVRNITAYNKKVNYDERMPKIVIVIDELADLMMMAPQDVEQSISRIAQKARACGIHMLVATQRPSVNVITGLIKANIPTRIAFMVSSIVDSRTILDSGGAERLLGYGDMLYLGGGMNKPIRVQGTFVSDEEIDSVVEYIKSQRGPEYLFQEKELLKKTEEPAKDELFDDVCEFMVREQSISTSLIQRHFQIGYNRAARIIDQLESLGYISGANGSKPRDVYLTEMELDEI